MWHWKKINYLFYGHSDTGRIHRFAGRSPWKTHPCIDHPNTKLNLISTGSLVHTGNICSDAHNAWASLALRWLSIRYKCSCSDAYGILTGRVYSYAVKVGTNISFYQDKI